MQGVGRAPGGHSTPHPNPGSCSRGVGWCLCCSPAQSQAVTHRGKSSSGGPGVALLPPGAGGRAAAVRAAHPGLGVAAAGVATGQRWGARVPPTVAAGLGAQGNPVGVGEAPKVLQLPWPPQRLVAGGMLPAALSVGASRARAARRGGAIWLVHGEAASIPALRARGLESTRITHRGLAMPGRRWPAALLKEPAAVSEGQEDSLIAALWWRAGVHRPLDIALQLTGAG